MFAVAERPKKTYLPEKQSRSALVWNTAGKVFLSVGPVAEQGPDDLEQSASVLLGGVSDSRDGCRFKASEVTVPVTPQQIGPKRAPRATAPISADANEANLTSSEAATPAAAHGFSGR